MDKIDINEIQKYLTAEIIGRTLICLETVDSTNTFASGIVNGANRILQLPDYNGIVVISETQTKGRGRLDRNWFSPQGGIWMTIILQPSLEMQDLSKITLLTASAITETLNKSCRVDLNIKWPNDILFKGKKLSGILAESEKLNDKIYLIIGIGINVNNDLSNYKNENLSAVSLKEITSGQINRNLLIAEILNEFEIQYFYYTKTLDFSSIFKKIENLIIS